MSFLRHASTRRLLSVLGGTIAAIAAGTAIALAALGGPGPKPPAAPLAEAVHGALTAPALEGVQARIRFTNHLIDASSIEGAGPLLSGATGRLWASADGHLRLELQSQAGDAQILSDGKSITIYDAASNTVYRATLPAHKDHAGKPDTPPTLATVQDWLKRLAEHATVSGATPSTVAGQAAYTVRLSPKHDGGLLGAAEIAWDAAHGVPLRAAVYAAGRSDPVLELEATDISFGPVSASDFDVTPPAGAHVVDLTRHEHSGGAEGHPGAEHGTTSLDAVKAQAGFPVSAPDALAGLPRADTRLVTVNGHNAALITYGRGLGGIAVLESKADPAGGAGHDTGPLGDVRLPTVSIDGTSAQELATALGTVLRFTRGGVDYVVIGSVPPAAAEAAARGL